MLYDQLSNFLSTQLFASVYPLSYGWELLKICIGALSSRLALQTPQTVARLFIKVEAYEISRYCIPTIICILVCNSQIIHFHLLRHFVPVNNSLVGFSFCISCKVRIN